MLGLIEAISVVSPKGEFDGRFKKAIKYAPILITQPKITGYWRPQLVVYLPNIPKARPGKKSGLIADK